VWTGGPLVRGDEDEVVQSVAGIAMMVSFLVTFAISTYADSGAQISFPTRAFALPVRTGLLVNGVVFFGALAITVIHLAWAYLFLLPLDTHYPLGSFTIYWVAALVTFQAIVWNLAEHPKSFVVVLLMAMTFMFGWQHCSYETTAPLGFMAFF